MKKLLIAVGGIISFLIITSVPSIANDVIFGCVGKKGKLRIVSDPGGCRKKETAITLNSQGPQNRSGIAGLQGEQGPQGPAGADGAPGLPGADGKDGSDGVPGGTWARTRMHRNADSYTYTIEPGESFSVVVEAPVPDAIVTGGGYVIDSIEARSLEMGDPFRGGISGFTVTASTLNLSNASRTYISAVDPMSPRFASRMTGMPGQVS